LARVTVAVISSPLITVTPAPGDASGASGAGIVVVVVVDFGTVEVVVDDADEVDPPDVVLLPDDPDPTPAKPALPDAIVVVVVDASSARPLAVALDVLYPLRDAATVTVEVPDAESPDTVMFPAACATVAPFVAVTA
jgi:hypothetical protein